MGRFIPSALQENLSSGASTTCLLMRIDPIGADSFGASLTNKTLVYDDGAGEVTYSAYVGMQPASSRTTSLLITRTFKDCCLSMTFPLRKKIFRRASMTMLDTLYISLTTKTFPLDRMPS
jgi:hypothetical protein